jgi:hypothetical protein
MGLSETGASAQLADEMTPKVQGNPAPTTVTHNQWLCE